LHACSYFAGSSISININSSAKAAKIMYISFHACISFRGSLDCMHASGCSINSHDSDRPFLAKLTLATRTPMPLPIDAKITKLEEKPKK